jgi:hypothetical protein
MESDPLDNAVCYHQGCPVCGRTLRIQVVLLGSRVYCQHCGGGFVAADVSLHPDRSRPGRNDDVPQSRHVECLLERAAVLLEQARS